MLKDNQYIENSFKKIPVFCINLKRAKERKERMLQEWTEKRGVELIFFDAIDQNDINIDNLPEPFKTNYVKSFSNPLKRLNLSIGEICCSISHAKVLEKIMELGLNEAVVLEDDAEPLFENAEEFFSNLYFYNFDEYQAGIVLLHDQLEESKKHKVISDENIFKQNYHNILTCKTTCSQSIYYRNTESIIEAYNAISLLVNPADWAWDHFDIDKRGILGISSKPLTAHLTDTTYLSENVGRFFIKNELETDLDEYDIFKIFSNIKKISDEYEEMIDIIYNKEDMDLESYFYYYYYANKEKFEKIGYHLIPIKWTNIYNNADKENILLKLHNELKKLPKNKKYFTISQHDNAPNLDILPPNTINFSAGGNIPNTIPIPLMSQNKNGSLLEVKSEKKDIFCNFVGSLTHPCRKEIFDELCNNQDYVLHIKNKWTNNLNQTEIDLFENITKRSKFTLCPRGYGSTSFRLYEAMKFGSVPVYISDHFHLPYKDIIDWNDICILIPTEAINNIDNILKLVSKTKYEKMLYNIKKIYPKIFKFEYMFEYIFNTLKSKSETYENTKLNKEDDIPSKIFTVCTDSHKPFIPWLETIYNIYPDIKIDYTFLDQDCLTGNYEECGWKETMIKKTNRIIELFDLYPEEKYFIFSDVDIQYFKPFHHITNRLLETHDILFQDDGCAVCMGFFICKNNQFVKGLFQKALELVISSTDESYQEQKAVNDILLNYDIKYTKLPKEFFNFEFYERPSDSLYSMEDLVSSEIEIPENIVMHHANWMVGVENKLEMLKFVSNKVKKLTNKKLTIVTALLKSDNFIYHTANSILPQLENTDTEWLIKYSDTNIPKSLLELSYNNPNVKIIGKPDKSLYDALNQAIEKIDGGYVLVLGSGDTLIEGSVKVIEETIKNNLDVDGICFCVNTKSGIFNPDLREIYKRMPACHQGMILKTDYIKAINGFNTKYRIAADYDLFCRYFKKFPVLIEKNEIVSNFMGDGLSELSLNECLLETALIIYTNWKDIIEDERILMNYSMELLKYSYKNIIKNKKQQNKIYIDENEYIFHIGINKSGTLSLNNALNELGILSCHFSDNLINNGNPITYLFNEECGDGFLNLKKYPFKAYVDIYFLQEKYEWLYYNFPNSKFILTVRDKKDWIEDRLIGFVDDPSYKESYKENYIKEWSTFYDEHIDNVKTFFSDKPNKLLIMDIYKGDGFDKLCPFLNLPIREEKFKL
jgi:GR25 family glycosyltransferase involved in LPS biosynthesis